MNLYTTNRSRVPMIAAVTLAAAVAGASRTSAQQKSPISIQVVRNIDEPGFNPYQTSHGTFFSVNSVSITEEMPIPAGKIAIIEHVSASGALSNGSIPRGFLRCFNGSEEVDHSLVFISQGSDSRLTTWATSQAIKCYATADGSLSIHVQTNQFQTLQPSWVVAVSGYVVPQ
jgi:hypothetical protein